MLILNQEKLFFIHIPKCAGTYVKAIAGHLDAYPKQFDRVKCHKNIGKIDFTHIPLNVMRDHFPEIFKKLDHYNSFAIIREPHERFRSSLSQYLKMYSDKPIHSFNSKELIFEAIRVIELIKKYYLNGILPYELIHFQPQNTYTHLNNEKKVTNLFMQEDVEKVIDFLKQSIEPNSINENVKIVKNSYTRNESKVYRSEFIRLILDNSYFSIRKIIHARLNTNLKNMLKKLFMKKLPKDYFETREIYDFVEEFYRLDIEIYTDLKRSKSNV